MISKTAKVSGFGTAKWRWVSHLTAEEKAAIDRGETVLAIGYPRGSHWSHIDTPNGGVYYVVTLICKHHYGHRVATQADLEKAGVTLEDADA